MNGARKLGIPIFAIVDTNTDPNLVDYPIPANDDSVRAIEVITKALADAVLEGKEYARIHSIGVPSADDKDSEDGQEEAKARRQMRGRKRSDSGAPKQRSAEVVADNAESAAVAVAAGPEPSEAASN